MDRGAGQTTVHGITELDPTLQLTFIIVLFTSISPVPGNF